MKKIDSSLLEEIDGLCNNYGISFNHDWDKDGQLIFFTGLFYNKEEDAFYLKEEEEDEQK